MEDYKMINFSELLACGIFRTPVIRQKLSYKRMKLCFAEESLGKLLFIGHDRLIATILMSCGVKILVFKTFMTKPYRWKNIIYHLEVVKFIKGYKKKKGQDLENIHIF